MEVDFLRRVGIFLVILAFLVIIAYAVFKFRPEGVNFDWKSFLLPHFKTATSSQPAGFGNGQQSSLQPAINPADIPAGFALKDLSPYFKKFSFSVSPAHFGSYGQVALYGYNSGPNSSPVDVTGWYFRAARGSLAVPQAVNVYDPSGLTPQSDIYFRSGDTLYLYTTASPIGVNIRMNKCLGYLPGINNSVPQLPLNCPHIDRSQIQNFSSPCQNYILSLGTCKIPGSNPPIPYNDYACQAFLSNLNYRGCFQQHGGDPDFLGSQWYAWTSNTFVDQQHDHIYLFDRQGLLVSEYIY